VRCVLIYNPAAGRKPDLRQAQIRQIASALTAEGHSVDCVSTTGPASAAAQAREAALASTDVIFACGGDGTVHEVLQGLVSENEMPASILGVIPLGCANALARHLRLSLDPATAALQQLRGTTCIIPVGRVVCSGSVRYFTVMAGIGPDGALVHSLVTRHKTQLGRFAYYLHATRLFATHRFHPFEIEYKPAAFGNRVIRTAVGVMATRVDSLGGLFSGLTSRRASVRHTALHLHILAPPAWLSLPLWFLSGWLRMPGVNPFLHSVHVDSFSCRSIAGHAPHLQADGEWLGCLPMQVSMVPNALRILLPHI